MAKNPPIKPEERPKLQVGRAEAQEQITKQISSGGSIDGRTVNSAEDVETFIADRDHWARYTRELLSSLFTTDKLRF